MGNFNISHNKVAIIGTGFVGSTIAYSLMLDGIVSQLVLIDKNANIAKGHALDLMHCEQFTRAADIEAGDSYKILSGADIVVITAGMKQKPGQSRDDLLKANVDVFKDIIPKIVKYNKHAILLIVTNPLDVMTYLAYKLSGFGSCRVFGTGTALDTVRLKYVLGRRLKLSSKDITAYVLGEHGDSQFVWWSHANVGGIPITDLIDASNNHFSKIYSEVRDVAYEIIQNKGATYFAIAMVVTRIVKAILLDQSRVFTLSTVLDDSSSNLSISVPTVIRRSGICSRLPLNLDESEKILFDQASKKIGEGIAFIKNHY